MDGIEIFMKIIIYWWYISARPSCAGRQTGDTPLSDLLKAYIKQRDNKRACFFGVPTASTDP